MKTYTEIFDRYYFIKNRIKNNIESYLDLLDNLKIDKQQHNALSLSGSFNSSKFKIIVLGKIGAGKSSLINSILNQRVLKTTSGLINSPDSISPVTETIYKIRFSDDSYEESTVKYETNSYNETEVTIPAGTVKDDIEIYDTPGLTQSTLLQAAYYEYISASDLVIYVFNPSIPLDDAEIRYIQKNISGKDKRSIFFAINLADTYPEKQALDNLKLVYEAKLKEALKTESLNLFFVSSNYYFNLEDSIFDYLIGQKGSKKLLRNLKALYMSLLETAKHLSENTDSDNNKNSSDMKKLEIIKQEVEILSRGLANKTDKKEIQEELDSFHRIGINIKDCARFILNSVEKYELPEETKIALKKDASLILEKESSNALYLGVVGEFSSGKSTLINAFMRSIFLKTDTLPETTSAATVLKYGETPDIELKLKSGTRIKYSEDKDFFDRINALEQNHELEGEEKLKELLALASADEKVAENVEQVTLYINAEGLKNGLAIVDLPGTDVENNRHIEVTKNSIHTLCDAVIVVIPADKPLTLTLVNFINENLNNISDKCFFVVTKLELMRRARDREMVLENISKRITSELNIENPKVYPAPSLIFSENTIEKTDASELFKYFKQEDVASFINEFFETETQIYSFLKENKLKLQIEKLSVLMVETLSKLKECLEKQEETFNNRHEALMKNRVKDLDSFIKEYRVNYSGKIFNNYESYKSALQTYVKNCRTETLERLTLMLNNASNSNQIGLVIKNNINPLLDEMKNKIINFYNNLLTQLFDNSSKYKTEFEEQFTALYKTLEALDTSGQISEFKTNVDFFNNKLQEFRNSNFLGYDFDEYLKRQRGLLAGGAIGGAAIGTAIAPIIGTAIGALIGGFVGTLFGPSVEELRKKYLTQLDPMISSFYGNLLNALSADLQNINTNTANQLFISMDHYFNIYGNLVKRMIEQDEQQEKQLELFSKSIKFDINKLIMYQKSTVESEE